jgi:uncharacterized protein YbjT (DUF2867 family)
VFGSERELEDHLTTPGLPLVEDMKAASGDLVVLGAGGKMGPTLCRLARRALDLAGRHRDRVVAVSRWTDHAAAEALRAHGVEVMTFDLLGEDDLFRLPEAPQVVFMVGAKFGTSGRPDLAWAVNAALPDRVARRYKASRIVSLSTGNVYPLVPPASGGCRETGPVGPVGEYAMSCLGRERVFQYAAITRGTSVALVRLNYAVDLRYGVLADVGMAVLTGEAVDVSTPAVNVVWQRYANEVVLRCLGRTASPGFVLNLTGPETASVRSIALRFGELLGTEPVFVGEEAPTALLSDASLCHGLFGYPDVALGALIGWQAHWLSSGLPMVAKPTKFAVRDGRF